MNSSSVASLNILKTMESCEIDMSDLREQRPDDREKTSQFFEYGVGTDERISVESTAASVMEEVLRFPAQTQARLFLAILDVLKKPGEQVVLEGDKKRRGARAVRLTSNNPKVHKLLLTH